MARSQADPDAYRPGALTGVLADPRAAGSLSARARMRRWGELLQRFPAFGEMRVIDLGGTADFWRSALARPAFLVLLNLVRQPVPWDGARAVAGDACAPPPALAHERFDLVFSNSVIGHVGGHRARTEFAASVHTMAGHHWVQTPYRYFPIDPCFVFPGRPLLPLRLQAAIARRWRMGHRRAGSHHDAVESALSVELLSATELAHYFPASEIWRERLGGLTKSIVAIA
jgi:hypothetical protein